MNLFRFWRDCTALGGVPWFRYKVFSIQVEVVSIHLDTHIGIITNLKFDTPLKQEIPKPPKPENETRSIFIQSLLFEKKEFTARHLTQFIYPELHKASH